MRNLEKLFENNTKWVLEKLKKDPNFFKNLSHFQKPKYLWIGCSDSRILPNEILGLKAGELFVYRNIANLFVKDDIGCLSVLEYAIDFLKIQNIIICGHYGCGGIKEATQSKNKGNLYYWLKDVRDIYDINKNELEKEKDLEKRLDLLAELNIKKQVIDVCKVSFVKNAWRSKQPLSIHGLIYDLKKGYLKDLDFCFSNALDFENFSKKRPL